MEPSVGRIVHYQTQSGDVLPAIIVHVFNPALVNLQVFGDSPRGTSWETSVVEGYGPGQWHWPRKS